MKIKKSISMLLSIILILSVFAPISVFADGNPVITVQSVAETAGSTVNISVTIKNNPGILGATLKFSYDDNLTLLNASSGEAFSALTMTKPGNLSSPCNFVWDGQDLNDDDIKDGNVITLKFAINENTAAGTKCMINVSYDSGDIVDKNLSAINPELVNGCITVIDYLPGDLNSDRKINSTDIIMLRRHIAGKYEQTINELAGDVNADGKFNSTDIIMLRRYVADGCQTLPGGYNVELKPGKPKEADCEHELTATEYKAATCTVDGNIAYWHCSKCDKYFSDENGNTVIDAKNITIKSSGHTIVVDARVEPTDTTPGKTEGQHCSVCNEILVKQETIPPLKNTYTIQYACDMVPQADDTYTYGVEKLLPIPTLDKYTFVGWSDKDGKMWKTIPAGTTGDMVLYANWSSDRAKAEAVKNLGEPIVCEDSENGLILFGYEIGTIKNIPLYTTLQLQCANGLISTVSMTNQNTISVTDAKTVANKISNATTNSSTWTLSKDWKKTTEVSQSYLDQTGESREEAEQRATSSTGTYNVAQSNSGKKSTTDTSGGTYNLSINNGHSKTQTVEKGSSYELGVNTKISSEISAEYAGIGAKIGAEIGTSENYSESSKRTSSGTNSWGINFDKTNTKSHASVDESSWNTSSGYSESNTVSKNNTVSKAVSKMISQQYGYGSSYAEGGSNSESNALTSTDTSSNEFSSSLTYSNSQIETKTTSFSSTGNTHGNYRMVMSGTAHVFAVVCYDVAKKEYFVYTYSVLGDGSNGDDAPKEYLDYSWDGTFDDYETSVIPFEIPYYVNQYVNGRIIKTDGLTINLDTGIVEGYTPNQNNPDNMVVIPSYVRVDNNDGTFSSVKIKGISPRLFKDNTDIVGVSLSSFIDEIPESAFEGCTSLKEVICPNVTKMADNAFSGCTSLSDFTLSDNIKEIGTDAFKNVPNIKAIASSAQMAQSVASCGAERISLDISAIPESESANMLFDIGEITSFELQGKDKEYKGLGIKSDANTTIINGITFTENTQIPMELSSDNVTLDRVTVDCSGYALVLKSTDTNLVLNRTINLISDSENTVLCKNISLSNLNSSVVGKLNVNGNLLVNGSISGENYITVSDGKIIYISDKDFENCLSMHSVFFDANGGSVDNASKSVTRNTAIGELPTAEFGDYTLLGWYTEDGKKLTEDTVIDSDLTVYAKWNNWDGSSTEPAYDASTKTYTITNGNEIAWVSDVTRGRITDGTNFPNDSTFSGYTIELANNIYLNDVSNWENWNEDEKEANVNQFESIASFSGCFEGQGYRILGMYGDGLFTIIEETGKVSGVSISNGLVFGQTKQFSYPAAIGAIATFNDGTIYKCINECNVVGYGRSRGGISGENNGSITYCANSGNIICDIEMGDATTSSNAGGIVGYNRDTVSYSYNTGYVKSIGSVNNMAGGIIGAGSGTIRDCYNLGDVYSSKYCGGIAGGHPNSSCSPLKIYNCHNSRNNLYGKNFSGGIVGTICIDGGDSYIEDCYSSANDSIDGEIIGKVWRYNSKKTGKVRILRGYSPHSKIYSSGADYCAITSTIRSLNDVNHNCYGINSSINNGEPYLKSLKDTYSK